jgi:hypothetical protein
LPDLLVGEAVVVPRHAGQADAVRDLPVVLADRVVGDAVSEEELRRMREHAFGDGRLRPVRQAVADGAIGAIELGGCEVRGLIRLEGRGLGRLLLHVRGQADAGHLLLERHGFCRGGDRHHAGEEVDADSDRDDEKSEDEPGDELAHGERPPKPANRLSARRDVCARREAVFAHKQMRFAALGEFPRDLRKGMAGRTGTGRLTPRLRS